MTVAYLTSGLVIGVVIGFTLASAWYERALRTLSRRIDALEALEPREGPVSLHD